jgi:branched-chain amino acid transport system substrate-binding protein
MNKNASSNTPQRRLRQGWRRGMITAASAAALGIGAIPGAHAADPIRIGVIAENSAISGVAITNGAMMAADEINAAGGINGRKVEIIDYDDHNSATDAVRAFQRAATQDHVVAVVGSYMSEVALALEPWAARLHVPFITPGAASNEITRHVKEDYARNKYTFHGYLTSTAIADANCDFSHDFLVEKLGMKTTVVLSEDAAWTKPLDEESKKCLPKAGLQILDAMRVSPDTTDFTPIFNKIEGERPDVITTGISHVGVQPTVQWHSEQVPVPMSGISSQATTTTFWRDTNGATEGVIAQVVAAPDVAITPKTVPYAAAYFKRFGVSPAYTGYTADDDVHIIAEAVGRAGSDDADKIVAEMEKTDYVGTVGRIEFYGQDSEFPHGLKYGKDFVSGLMIQWQDGKQVTVWPAKIANGTLHFPPFIKLPQQHASAQ